MIAMPLDAKVKHSLNLIRKWVKGYSNIVLSFSGGKDSIVMSHLVLQVDKGVKHIYLDTRNEHKSVTPFVKDYFKRVDGVVVYPEKTLIEVFREEGIPVYSKIISQHIARGQGKACKKNKYLDTKILKYKPLVGSGVKISDKCCYWLKKKPAEDFYKEEWY